MNVRPSRWRALHRDRPESAHGSTIKDAVGPEPDRGRQHRAGHRLPQRLVGRTRQQRRADTPGAVRADGADRLVLAGEVVAERPQRDIRLGRDVLDGDVLQHPLHRQPQRGRTQRLPDRKLLE